MLGMKSAAVREILPRATDEAVHRDYLVSTERSSYPVGPWPPSSLHPVADICRAAKRAVARARADATPPSRTPRWRRSRCALQPRVPRDPARPTSATCRPAREDDIGDALLDRLRLDEGRIERDRAGRRADRRAAGPRRRGDRGRAPAQRPGRAQGARAARRRRGRVRGAPERDDRRRRAVPEVGQRDRPAGLLRRPPTPTPRSPRSPPRRPSAAGLPEGCVSLVAGGGREELAELATQTGTVDLIIPRGGEGLKDGPAGGRHGAGDLRRLRQLPRLRRRLRRPRPTPRRSCINAKTQRPGVCNAAETLLVHERRRRASSCRGCCARSATRACWCAPTSARSRSRRGRPVAASQRCAGARSRPPARRTGRPSIWRSIIAVGIVDSVEEAIEHIARYGSGHSEAIVTRDTAAARCLPARAWTRPACTSTPPRASPTAGSSGWGRRSATPPRSSTPAGRSGCASCAPSSTSIEGDGHVRP